MPGTKRGGGKAGGMSLCAGRPGIDIAGLLLKGISCSFVKRSPEGNLILGSGGTESLYCGGNAILV